MEEINKVEMKISEQRIMKQDFGSLKKTNIGKWLKK